MVEALAVEIYPDLQFPVSCVNCQSKLTTVHDFLFEGIHVLLDCSCQDCKTSFFQTLPVSHDALSPIAFTKDGATTRYDNRTNTWLARPLIDAMTKGLVVECGVEKKIYEPGKDKAILLNCLDDCFGHAYAKLWNAQFLVESFPEFSIIVLITKNLEWLVPKGISEVWVVNGTMRDMSKYVFNLQREIKAEISRFSKFYISTAKVFHDTGKINFELFVKTKRFKVSDFANLDPCITFVLREDRFWHPNRIEEFLNRVVIKLKWQKYFAGFFVMRQNRLVRKAIAIIRVRQPKIKFNITGFGRRTIIDDAVHDRRVKNITNEVEREWCEVYSESHIVIGVHGSNMLIPTSLSAGFIEILPEHKIQHMGEDTISHYSGRYSVLLGRHLHAFVFPGLLAQHAIHMLSFGEISRMVEAES